MQTTVGQLLIDDALPEDMRGQPRTLDAKGIRALFQEVAVKHPKEYRDITQRLMEVGSDAMYTSGGYSAGLKHMLPTQTYVKERQKLMSQIQRIAMNKNLSDKDREAAIIKAVQAKSSEFEKSIFEESSKEKNPYALQIISGAKGKPFNLRSIRGGDLLYQNHRGQELPIAVLRSYSEGLSPAEYWAGTYGARKGVVDLKTATQDAGYFGKQLTQAAHRLLVTAKDSDEKHEDDHPRGFPVDVDDTDNEGAMLAHTFGPYKRNTVLTPKILAHLKDLGHDKILVRSPTVGGPPDGGVYAHDVGVRERGAVAPIGDFVGIGAAQAIAEPLAQAQIGSKHTGGVAGAGAGVSGFKAINQLVQIPKVFPGGAAHSQTDGRVESIEPAPGGGHNVYINGQRHYVGVGFDLRIKPGDTVEAGDMISNGLPNPAEIVQHKGIGEGRRAFVEAFKRTAAEAGFGLHRRNIELVARGLINHVKLNDSMGDYVSDDIIPYSTLEHIYQPRDGHQVLAPTSAVGKYLERPVMHYSIGTRITPAVAQQLQKFGVKRVFAHHETPAFEPHMVRGMENLSHDQDWMTRMLGSNLEKGLLRSVHRGGTSDEQGTSYVPSLARGVDFGKEPPIKGWSPTELINRMAQGPTPAPVQPQAAPAVAPKPIAPPTPPVQSAQLPSVPGKKWSLWG